MKTAFIILQRMRIVDKLYEPLYYTGNNNWSANIEDAYHIASYDDAMDTISTFPKNKQFDYSLRAILNAH
jgi:hypothetical protein